MIDRLGVFAFIGERGAEVVVRFGKIGPDAKSFVAADDGVVVIALIGESKTEIVESLGEGGLDTQSFGVIVMRKRYGRSEADCGLEFRYCFIDPALLRKRDPEVRVCSREIRLEADRFSVVDYSFIDPALIGKRRFRHTHGLRL